MSDELITQEWTDGAMAVVREMKERWSLHYNQGYDGWPGVNDLDSYDSYDSYEIAHREREMHCKETGYPIEHYTIVRSMATPWEAVE